MKLNGATYHFAYSSWLTAINLSGAVGLITASAVGAVGPAGAVFNRTRLGLLVVGDAYFRTCTVYTVLFSLVLCWQISVLCSPKSYRPATYCDTFTVRTFCL